MAVIVDTADAAPEDQFSLWAQGSAEMFEPIGLRRVGSGPFHGRAEAFDLGALKLLRLASDRAFITRDRAMVRQSDPEWIQVMLQTGGRHVISQDDRCTPVAEGDIVAWQSTSPYTIDVQAAWSGLILVCPLALLGPQADRVVRQTARRHGSSEGVGLVLRQYLLTLQAAFDQDSLRGSEARLGEGALELVRALFLRGEPAEADRSAALRRRVHEHIEARLGDPTLSAPAIAAAHFVSRSRLDRLFEAQGTTVGRWIRHRRLEGCRRDLADPSLADRTVWEIASRWGFVSQSHFSRAFRAAFGRSPREMRPAPATPGRSGASGE